MCPFRKSEARISRLTVLTDARLLGYWRLPIMKAFDGRQTSKRQ